jgi:hypothetical protein
MEKIKDAILTCGARTLLIHIGCLCRITDTSSASCQLIPALSQLAPTPCRLCERGLSRRFFARCGSLFAMRGCVEALVHSALVLLWLSHAPTTRTRGKDFQGFRRVGGAGSVAVQAPDGKEPWGWEQRSGLGSTGIFLGCLHTIGRLCPDKGVRRSCQTAPVCRQRRAGWEPLRRTAGSPGPSQGLATTIAIGCRSSWPHLCEYCAAVFTPYWNG